MRLQDSIKHEQNQLIIKGMARNHLSKLTDSGVSVRPGNTPTQEEMRELAGYAVSDLKEVFDPMVAALERVLHTVDEVENYEIIDTRIVKNSNVSCFFVESKLDIGHGMTLVQTYICPFGDKSVKLTMSCDQSQKMQFKPILEYTWASLWAR